jgi:hypothetical protein
MINSSIAVNLALAVDGNYLNGFLSKIFNMKKLRMIVTSVIVLAIVGSAFAFKVKIGHFCILTTNDPSDNCTTYTGDKRITTSILAKQWKYYPTWDGNPIACTAANNGLCTAIVRLTYDF